MLSKRVEEAKAASRFAVWQTDRDGKVKNVTLPGHDGKTYRVFLKRAGSTIKGDCYIQADRCGQLECKGGSHATCYHILAAVIIAAREAGGTVRFCETAEDAERLRRMGGTSVTVVGGGHPVFAVYDGPKVDVKKSDTAILVDPRRGKKSRMYK